MIIKRYGRPQQLMCSLRGRFSEIKPVKTETESGDKTAVKICTELQSCLAGYHIKSFTKRLSVVVEAIGLKPADDQGT